MLTIRCTTKLLKRLRVDDAPPPRSPDSRLGDWYATVLQMRPQHLVLLVNEPTRLPVVMAVRDFLAPPGNIAGAISHVLAEIGVEADVLVRERRAMAVVSFARPSSRSISETMNELALQLEQIREYSPNLPDHAVSLKLAAFPVAIPRLGRQRPADAAKELLAHAGR